MLPAEADGCGPLAEDGVVPEMWRRFGTLKGADIIKGPDAIQQPAGRVGNPMDIANMVLYLCSDKAGFITAENICIDGGMTRQMIYHGDNGWILKNNAYIA